jgi:PadR family transcriptional regulator PadR
MRIKADSRADLLPGTLEMLILKTLSIQPMHGYGIARHLKTVSADVLKIEEGSLYPALQRLLVKDLVKAEWRVSEKNRRARVYQLTAAGRRQLGEERAGFLEVFEAIRRVLAQRGKASKG